MRNAQNRAADRAAASTETHGMAQKALQGTIRRLATGEHRYTDGEIAARVQEDAEIAARVQEDAEIAADFDPRGGVR